MTRKLARPENLTVAEFGRLSGRSKAQIYTGVKANRYLALTMCGPRDMRLPDFQLRPEGQALAKVLLDRAKNTDPWTLHVLLTEPNEVLNGKVPGRFVQYKYLQKLALLLISQLGFELEVQRLGQTEGPCKPPHRVRHDRPKALGSSLEIIRFRAEFALGKRRIPQLAFGQIFDQETGQKAVCFFRVDEGVGEIVNPYFAQRYSLDWHFVPRRPLTEKENPSMIRKPTNR